jgi:hypothetical protein
VGIVSRGKAWPARAQRPQRRLLQIEANMVGASGGEAFTNRTRSGAGRNAVRGDPQNEANLPVSAGRANRFTDRSQSISREERKTQSQAVRATIEFTSAGRCRGAWFDARVGQEADADDADGGVGVGTAEREAGRVLYRGGKAWPAKAQRPQRRLLQIEANMVGASGGEAFTNRTRSGAGRNAVRGYPQNEANLPVSAGRANRFTNRSQSISCEERKTQSQAVRATAGFEKANPFRRSPCAGTCVAEQTLDVRRTRRS